MEDNYDEDYSGYEYNYDYYKMPNLHDSDKDDSNDSNTKWGCLFVLLIVFGLFCLRECTGGFHTDVDHVHFERY